MREFLEKPSDTTQLDTNLISAGAYVLERSILDLIAPDQKVSIEREVWPLLVDNGLYGYADDQAYWIDIGTPARYLQVTFDILEGNVQTDVGARLGDGYVDVDAGATVDGRVVPPAVVERGAHIAARRPRRQPRRDRRGRQHRPRLDRRAQRRAARRTGWRELRAARLHHLPRSGHR